MRSKEAEKYLDLFYGLMNEAHGKHDVYQNHHSQTGHYWMHIYCDDFGKMERIITVTAEEEEEFWRRCYEELDYWLRQHQLSVEQFRALLERRRQKHPRLI